MGRRAWRATPPVREHDNSEQNRALTGAAMVKSKP